MKPRLNRFSLILIAALTAASWSGAGLMTSAARAGPDTPPQSAQLIDAAAVSRKEHPKLVAQFGGEYHDARVRQYVRRIGNKLVQHTSWRGRPFKFTVLNSDIVNAFAMPGGYVYVTRGLLALANNEAELAGVLAHEIGHVTRKHGEQRMQQSVIAQLGIGILAGVLDSDLATGVAQLGAAGVLSSYSRAHEFEADKQGVQYLTRAGYDPRAMATFLDKLIAEQRLQSTLQNRGGRDRSVSFLSTHPRTQDRVQLALRQAGNIELDGRRRGTATHMRMINGLYFGGDPKNGIINGRRFTHPQLGFSFQVPEGFHLINGARQVTAVGPQNARMVFDFARRPRGTSMTNYLAQAGRKMGLRNIQRLRINGYQAATGFARLRGQRGTTDVRVVAIAFKPNTIARFQFATPPNVTNRYAESFQRTAYSFRRASGGRARPLKVRTTRVKAGQTVRSFASRMPFPSHRTLRFRTLNGLGPNEELQPGQWVKYVTR